MKVLRLSVLPLRTVLVALTLSALALPPFVGAADFSLNPARDFGAIRRIDPRDYSGLAVVREDGSGLSSSTAAAFRAALEVFSKAESSAAFLGVSAKAADSDLLDGYHASAFNASDALNLRLDGSRAMTGNQTFSGNYGILQSTSDGADTGYTFIAGGGVPAGTLRDRGGSAQFFGNEYSGAGGQVRYHAGDVSTGDHIFYTGAGTERFRIGYDGTSTFSGNINIGTNRIMVGNYGYLQRPPVILGAMVNSVYGPAIWYNAVYDTVDARWESQASGRQTAITLAEGEFGVSQSTTANEGGQPITWRTPFLIKSNGNLLIGTTTDDGTNKLQVNGGAKIAGTIESTGAATVGGDLTVTGASTNFRNAIKAVDGAGSGLDADTVPNATPASAAAAGTAGSIRYDANYIYICVAANTWKRAAISTW